MIFVLNILNECRELDFRSLVRMLNSQLQKKKNGFIEMRFFLINRFYEQIIFEI